MSDSIVEEKVPEHNVTGQDFSRREHFRYAGPLLDVHAHVTLMSDSRSPGIGQAEQMMAVAGEFGVERVWSMCPPDDIPVLRERFGRRIAFNGSISKKRDEPEDVAYRLLDRFLEQGVRMIKFWAAPRGRDRGLFVDAPWRIEAARRARAAGVSVVMVHVADPDAWFRHLYTDPARYGTKPEQYAPFERMLAMFPDLTWIGAHMGGDPESPDHLEELLERYPHLYLDTSATKWQVREVSAHREAIRDLICRRPERFLFGSDLVTRPDLPREHYVSRYWCHRTLWESGWEAPSPIDDPDHDLEGRTTPTLRGLELPEAVLRQVYHDNARRLLPA
jgi:predicted TIM-barrel fold metal-dependent hydrolase